jgi:hypothetical protein
MYQDGLEEHVTRIGKTRDSLVQNFSLKLEENTWGPRFRCGNNIFSGFNGVGFICLGIEFIFRFLGVLTILFFIPL